MLIEILGIIVVLMALRTLVAQNRSERLLYLNVIGFSMSAIIALYIQTPFGAIIAITFFITSTLSSNAIAYSLGRVKEEILVK
ncbi:MAG: putative membrane protein [Methanobacterium sp. Maddingley MBC34]|jgi:energy-converting hydrogenase A subunit C|nr:MAG: putative membrane protein [Methanobacterium sp. Maddingley MBC34]